MVIIDFLIHFGAVIFASLVSFIMIVPSFIMTALSLKTPVITTWQVRPKGWNQGKLKIGILADPHVGLPSVSMQRFRNVIKTLNEQDADLIVLLGDYRARYFYKTTLTPLDKIAKALTKLDAPLGVYGILGNHDWWDDKPTMKRGEAPCITETIFRAAGLNMLENENTTIDNRFNLIGLGDQWAFKKDGALVGVDDLDIAMNGIDPRLPNILLAHEPDIFPNLPDNIPLTLSGHTHGGQVIILGKPVATASKYGSRYYYGHIQEFGRDLIVSAGIGTSVLPFRFGRPPEITIVEIDDEP